MPISFGRLQRLGEQRWYRREVAGGLHCGLGNPYRISTPVQVVRDESKASPDDRVRGSPLLRQVHESIFIFAVAICRPGLVLALHSPGQVLAYVNSKNALATIEYLEQIIHRAMKNAGGSCFHAARRCSTSRVVAGTASAAPRSDSSRSMRTTRCGLFSRRQIRRVSSVPPLRRPS